MPVSKFFGYFQIAVLIIFLLLFAGKILYLYFRKNINPITIVVGKKGVQKALELFFVIGLIIWIILVILYSLQLEFLIIPPLLNIQLIDSLLAKFIGATLIAFGFVIYVVALIRLGNSWRTGIDYKAPGELVTKGIYSVSRNPIFVFLVLYFFGTFLINGTLIFLVFIILAIMALHYQILQEEKFLARIYGAAYREYCARTGRYLTWKRSS